MPVASVTLIVTQIDTALVLHALAGFALLQLLAYLASPHQLSWQPAHFDRSAHLSMVAGGVAARVRGVRSFA